MGDSLVTVDIGAGLAAYSISIGAAHSCTIVTSLNIVKCWGASNSGQLGQGNTNNIGDNASEMGSNLLTIDLGTDTATASIPTATPANTPTPLPQMTTISDSLVTPVALLENGGTNETPTIGTTIHPSNSYVLSDQSLSMYLEIPKYSWQESYQLTIDTSIENCHGTLPSGGGKILKCSSIQIHDYLGNPLHIPKLWQNLTLRMILRDSPEDMPSGYLSTVISALKGEIRLQGYNPKAIGKEWIDLHTTTDRSEKQVSFITKIDNNRVVGLINYEPYQPQTVAAAVVQDSTVTQGSPNKASIQATPTPTFPTLKASGNDGAPDVGGHSVTKSNIAIFLIIGIVLVIMGSVLYRPKFSQK
jgi:hypothetical protein